MMDNQPASVEKGLEQKAVEATVIAALNNLYDAENPSRQLVHAALAAEVQQLRYKGKDKSKTYDMEYQQQLALFEGALATVAGDHVLPDSASRLNTAMEMLGQQATVMFNADYRDQLDHAPRKWLGLIIEPSVRSEAETRLGNRLSRVEPVFKFVFDNGPSWLRNPMVPPTIGGAISVEPDSVFSPAGANSNQTGTTI